MFANYLKVTLRNIVSDKLSSTINILGLSLGIACCILLSMFVRDETSFDEFHENLDRIYRLNLDLAMQPGDTMRLATTPLPAIPYLTETFDQIESGTRLSYFRDVVKRDKIISRETLTFLDEDFFDIFSFKILHGDPNPLSDPSNVVLTQTAAEKYFGSDTPIGKNLSIKLQSEFHIFTVSAIIEPPPSNSSIKYNIILNTSRLNDVHRDYNDMFMTDWTGTDVASYLFFADGADPSVFGSRLNSFVSQFTDTTFYRYSIQSLSDIHLGSPKAWTIESTSNRKYSYILSLIAAAVLLIACFNFTNLAIARSSSRAREIGIRKSIGANRSDLIYQFLGEAIIMAFIATLIGVVLAELSLPVFNRLTAKHLSILHSSGITTIIILFGIASISGVLAGIYPALIISRLKPVEILRNRLKIGGDNLITGGFIVLQFAISIVLITSTLVMTRQISYMKNRDLGFNEEQLLSIVVNTPNADLIFERLKTETEKIPSIISVSKTDASIAGSYTSICSHSEVGEISKEVYMYRIDPDFMKTIGAEMVEGRFFSREMPSDVTAAVVNERYVAEFELEDPIGKQVDNCINDEQLRIIGVVKDFHFLSMRWSIKPMVLYLRGPSPTRYFYARISPDNMSATINDLKSTWNKIAPDVPFDYFFIDEYFEHCYFKEERWTAIIRYSALFTAAIACLGLFGLAALATRRRAREISIRMVHGAGTWQIIGLFNRKIVIMILIASIPAIPVAYIILSGWLESFAYRVGVSADNFILAFLTILLLAVVTVSIQTIRAAMSNPAEVLRNE